MENEVARDHMFSLTSKVSQFRADDAYCDIEIHVEDSVFKCHRLILAAASQYFHVMFGGKFKESSASEVNLKDVIQPQIFGEIVKFIYTGKVSINNDNLYPLVRASDFFELPSIAKLCFQYAQQNVDALQQNGVEMFCYTRATGKATFSEFIKQYVFKHLDQFSQTHEFLQIEFEDLKAILNLIPRSASTTSQDVYIYAIMRWIRRTNRSPQDMKSHFDELLKLVNFVRLSSDCMEDLIRMNINDLIAMRQNGVSIDEIPPRITHAIDSEMKEGLHVYVKTYSDDRSQFVTGVFSIREQSGEATNRRWVSSYQFDCTNSYQFMRTTVLDGSLYCLSSSLAQQPRKVSQIFRTSSSISLCSNSHLKPPPLILDHYDMCGHGKHIYVYNQNPFRTIIRSCPLNTSFDHEQLSRGIYLYDREVDIWLPLPPLVHKFVGSCLTCDDQMVYLIGGWGCNKNVQGYDYRTSKWISLSSTNYNYDCAACCAHRKKIYVAGGLHTNFMEMYDPVAGKWKYMGQLPSGRRSNYRIDSFLHSNYLVTAGENLSRNSDVGLYNVKENEWKFMTSLYQAVMDSDLKYKKDPKVIDMVNYRP